MHTGPPSRAGLKAEERRGLGTGRGALNEPFRENHVLCSQALPALGLQSVQWASCQKHGDLFCWFIFKYELSPPSLKWVLGPNLPNRRNRSHAERQGSLTINKGPIVNTTGASSWSEQPPGRPGRQTPSRARAARVPPAAPSPGGAGWSPPGPSSPSLWPELTHTRRPRASVHRVPGTRTVLLFPWCHPHRAEAWSP